MLPSCARAIASQAKWGWLRRSDRAQPAGIITTPTRCGKLDGPTSPSLPCRAQRTGARRGSAGCLPAAPSVPRGLLRRRRPSPPTSSASEARHFHPVPSPSIALKSPRIPSVCDLAGLSIFRPSPLTRSRPHFERSYTVLPAQQQPTIGQLAQAEHVWGAGSSKAGNLWRMSQEYQARPVPKPFGPYCHNTLSSFHGASNLQSEQKAVRPSLP
jgi:hypothetical protein